MKDMNRRSASESMNTWRRAQPVALAAALVAIWSMSTTLASAEKLVAFDPKSGELSEGVTVDDAGNVFASLSPLGKLVKIAPGSNKAEPFGEVSGLMKGDIGLIGLAVDAHGDIYGGVFSANPEARGVWKFDRKTGAAERIKGTENIALPNAIDFDEDGKMYVTNSILGAVWRVPTDGTVEKWIVDPLLAGNKKLGFPFPVGANGIVVRDRMVYVGVTETGKIVTVPINSDGSAGPASVFAEVAGAVIDGIAFDARGDVYFADFVADAIVKVSADGKFDKIASAGDGLDAPASLIFGKGAGDENTLYVSNFSIALGRPLGAGPSIVAIKLKE